MQNSAHTLDSCTRYFLHLAFLIFITITLQMPLKFLRYEYFKYVYRTRAIISRGLYIFFPVFKDHFFVFKEVISENYVFMYGFYSRAAYDGARTVSIYNLYLSKVRTWCLWFSQILLTRYDVVSFYFTWQHLAPLQKLIHSTTHIRSLLTSLSITVPIVFTG